MALYEHIYLARQDISGQQVDALTAQFKSVIESFGGKFEKELVGALNKYVNDGSAGWAAMKAGAELGLMPERPQLADSYLRWFGGWAASRLQSIVRGRRCTTRARCSGRLCWWQLWRRV